MEMIGTSGNDTLRGTYGSDMLQGGDGNDYLEAAGEHDELYGGADDDVLINLWGSNLLDGGAGKDYFELNYSASDTTLRGGDGDDRVSGIASNEESSLLVDLGAGDDQVKLYVNDAQLLATGGSGVDSYELLISGNGSATVTDFVAGAGGDRLVLLDYMQRIHHRPDYEAGNPFDKQLGYLRAVQDGADTLVEYDADGAALGDSGWQTIARLQNVDVAQLTAYNMGDPLGYAPGGGMPAGQFLTAVYNVDLYGGHGDDTLQGTRYSDELDGGAGNDVLYSGDAENRYLERGDEMRGDIGNDTLMGGGNNDTLYGGRGNDSLDGGGNNDLIKGEGGDDIIRASAGQDSISGGDGNDTIYFGGAFAEYRIAPIYDGIAVHNDARNEHAFLESVETLVFADTTRTFADLMQVRGTAGNDALLGSEFGDTIDGGQGRDTMTGLGGNDMYIVDNARDVVTEVKDGGTDTVSTKLAKYTLAAQVENLVYTGTVAFAGTGNELANEIKGAIGNDTLAGMAGNDTLTGNGGSDTLDGGAGEDTAVVLGKLGDYAISRPTTTSVVLSRTGETVTLRGIEQVTFADGTYDIATIVLNKPSPLADSLTGGDGNDTLDGLGGADTLVGGEGNDHYVVDVAQDIIIETGIDDLDTVDVALASGSYTLSANVENATVIGKGAVGIVGNASDNSLTGNAAVNVLAGGDGNDTLDGLLGADKLAGGGGDDLYIVDNAGDVVTEGKDGGADTVSTKLAKYTLAAQVENLVYTGTVAFAGTGNELANEIKGATGNDNLAGMAGNDTLTGNGGSDTLDGGAGEDTAVVLGKLEDYTISRPTTTSVVLSRTGETVTLRGIEQVRFADGTRDMATIVVNKPSPLADSLTGGDGSDTLDGLAGADTLVGGEGNDHYVVDVAQDIIIETGIDDLDTVDVALASGSYTLSANVENATVIGKGAVGIVGNASDNSLVGNAAVNVLMGEDGNDRLDGKEGADKLAGGAGNDLYIVDNAGDVVTEGKDGGTDIVNTKLAKYTLAAQVENLVYTGTVAFTGTGNELANEITGATGNDNLAGMAGNDTLTGNGGNDILDGGAGEDTAVVLGKLEDYAISRPTTTSVVLSRTGEMVTLRGIEQVTFADGTYDIATIIVNKSSPLADSLTGGDGSDTLDGLGGADTLVGGEGDDHYVVDVAQDVIIETGIDDIDTVDVALASGSYTLSVNVENATVIGKGAAGIVGNDSDNWLTGNAAVNVLAGGDGNDRLDGKEGADRLAGGAGDDTYVVDNARDVVTEGKDAGTDTVQTTLASYTLAAEVERLEYTGTRSFTGTGNGLANTITGGDGNDVLSGKDGDDVLVGGAGNDRLTGGSGADLFVLGQGHDTVTDFDTGIDRVRIDLDLEAADLVIFTQMATSFKGADVAKAIGTTSGAHAAGDTALFAIRSGAATGLFVFTSGDDDDVVSAGELVQIATLTGVVAPGDFAFG